jgi:two-component system, NtrC family, response regulator AtoC
MLYISCRLPRKDNTEEGLHAADVEALEQRVMEHALERTGSRNGAIFLHDAGDDALAMRFHVVEGLVVNVPGSVLRRRRDGRSNGIAFWVLDNDQSHLCNDTREDPHYAPYYLDVGSIAAVPIRWQSRPIGVLTVSAREIGAFDVTHIEELEALAASAARFLRRAQRYRASRDAGRPFLIKGLSPGWLEVERRIEHVARTNAAVLLQGESGTGKELVAHAIHFDSRRSTKPFVAVNCAALPEALLESLLFGHVRGAFTGATTAKRGEFQKADTGTLFLDELGELPLALQAKVLRAVEYGEVQPLGSDDGPIRVDVRLICATHRDLAAMVQDGQFRDDLYYRLGVMPIELPPLRSYKDNLEVLAQVFVQQAAERHELPTSRLTPDALAALHAHDFPGNVRELKNAMEHAVILASGQQISPEHLPRSLLAGTRPSSTAIAPSAPRPTLREQRERWLAPLERRYLEDLLVETQGRVTDAARLAGVDRVTFYRLLEKRGLSRARTSGARSIAR